MSINFNMHIPIHIVFGVGALNDLHKQDLPGKKALVIISNGKSARANGYLDRTLSELDKAGVEHVVFDKVEPNPTKSTVMAASAMAKKNRCDFILALGGGSCIDASKATAIVSTNDGDLWDYVQFGKGGKKQIAKKPLPIVAITTTAGTGSETDAAAVITNMDTNEKTGLLDMSLFPTLSIIDPELMLTVPPKLTAYQGFDALFHSVEGYTAKCSNLISDVYASAAIKNIGKYLPTAVNDGANIEARTHVAFANYLAGVVEATSNCTSEHSLEHAMSAYHPELPHGAGLIMISCAYFETLISKHACDEKFIDMAKFLGLQSADQPGDFIRVLKKLQSDCGVSDLKMSDYGITSDEFEKFVKNARGCMGFLFDVDAAKLSDDDCMKIYENSYK